MLESLEDELSDALLPIAPFAEPLLFSVPLAKLLLVTVALPRDEPNDA